MTQVTAMTQVRHFVASFAPIMDLFPGESTQYPLFRYRLYGSCGLSDSARQLERKWPEEFQSENRPVR